MSDPRAQTGSSPSVFHVLGSYAERIRGGKDGAKSASGTATSTVSAPATSGEASTKGPAAGKASTSTSTVSAAPNTPVISMSDKPKEAGKVGSRKDGAAEPQDKGDRVKVKEGGKVSGSANTSADRPSAASTPIQAAAVPAEEEGAWETVQSTRKSRGKEREKEGGTASGSGGASSSNWRDRPRDRDRDGTGSGSSRTKERKERERDERDKEKEKGDKRDKDKSDADGRHTGVSSAHSHTAEGKKDGRIPKGASGGRDKDKADKKDEAFSGPSSEAASSSAWPTLGGQATAAQATTTPTTTTVTPSATHTGLPPRSASASATPTAGTVKNAWGILGASASHGGVATAPSASPSNTPSGSGSTSALVSAASQPVRSQSMSTSSGQSAPPPPPAPASVASAASASASTSAQTNTSTGTPGTTVVGGSTDVDVDTPSPSSPSLGSINGDTVVETSVASPELGTLHLGDVDGKEKGESGKVDVGHAGRLEEKIQQVKAARAQVDDASNAETTEDRASGGVKRAASKSGSRSALPIEEPAQDVLAPRTTSIGIVDTTSATSTNSPATIATPATATTGKGADDDDDWRARPRKQPSNSALAADAQNDTAFASALGKNKDRMTKDAEGDSHARSSGTGGTSRAVASGPIKAAPPPTVNAWAARMAGASAAAKPATGTASLTVNAKAGTSTVPSPTPAQAQAGGSSTLIPTSTGQDAKNAASGPSVRDRAASNGTASQAQKDKSKKSSASGGSSSSTAAADLRASVGKDKTGLIAEEGEKAGSSKSQTNGVSSAKPTSTSTQLKASAPTSVSAWNIIAATGSSSANAPNRGVSTGVGRSESSNEPTPGEMSRLNSASGTGSRKKSGKKGDEIDVVPLSHDGAKSGQPTWAVETGPATTTTGSRVEAAPTPAESSTSAQGTSHGKPYSGAITCGYSASGSSSQIQASAPAIDTSAFPDLAQASSKGKGAAQGRREKGGSVAGDEEVIQTKKAKSKWTAIPAAELQAAADEAQAARQKQAQQSQSQSSTQATPSKKKKGGSGAAGQGQGHGQQGHASTRDRDRESSRESRQQRADERERKEQGRVSVPSGPPDGASSATGARAGQAGSTNGATSSAAAGSANPPATPKPGKRSENAPRRPSRSSVSTSGHPSAIAGAERDATNGADKPASSDINALVRQTSRISVTSNASHAPSTRQSPRKARSNLPSPIAATGPFTDAHAGPSVSASMQQQSGAGPSNHVLSPSHPLAGLPPLSAMSESAMLGVGQNYQNAGPGQAQGQGRQGGSRAPRGSFGQYSHPQGSGTGSASNTHGSTGGAAGSGAGSSRQSGSKTRGKGGNAHHDGSRSAGGYQSGSGAGPSSQRGQNAHAGGHGNYASQGSGIGMGQGQGQGQYQHQGQSQWVSYDQMAGYMIPVYAAGRLQQQQYMQQQQQQQQQHQQHKNGDGRNGKGNGNGANGSVGGNVNANGSGSAGEGESGKSNRGKGSKAQEGQSEMPAPLPQTQVPNLDALNYYVLGQVEYYFSMQNLAMDFFLRQQMDSEGWIDISMIASFNRVRSLTPDVEVVKTVMGMSSYLEVREDKVRLANGEAKRWVLPHAKQSPFAPDSPATLARQRTPLIGSGASTFGDAESVANGETELDADGNPLPPANGREREREQTPAEKQEQAEIELAAGAYAGGPMYPSYGYGVGGSVSLSSRGVNGASGDAAAAEGEGPAGPNGLATRTINGGGQHTNTFTSNKELAADVESALMKNTGMFASIRREEQERAEAEARAKAEAEAAADSGTAIEAGPETAIDIGATGGTGAETDKAEESSTLKDTGGMDKKEVAGEVNTTA